MCGSFLEYLCAIIFPPIAVLAATGCSCDLLINILLCCLFWLPGMCHACYIVGKASEEKAMGKGARQMRTNLHVHSNV